MGAYYPTILQGYSAGCTCSGLDGVGLDHILATAKGPPQYCQPAGTYQRQIKRSPTLPRGKPAGADDASQKAEVSNPGAEKISLSKPLLIIPCLFYSFICRIIHVRVAINWQTSVYFVAKYVSINKPKPWVGAKKLF